MNKKQIKRILKKNKKLFEDIGKYDETRELPHQRKRIYITLSVEKLNKLKEIKKRTGKPISRIIEDYVK